MVVFRLFSLFFVFVVLVSCQIGIDTTGTIILNTQGNVSFASPLVVDSSSPIDISTTISNYNAMTRGAQHIALFNFNSRRYQQLPFIGITVLASDYFTINGNYYIAICDGSFNYFLFKWDNATQQYLNVQTIHLFCEGVKHVSTNGKDFLVLDSYATSDVLYTWVSDTQYFGLGVSFTPSTSSYKSDFALLPGSAGAVPMLLKAGLLQTYSFVYNGTQFTAVSNPFSTAAYSARFFQIGSFNYAAVGHSGSVEIWLWNSTTNSFTIQVSKLQGVNSSPYNTFVTLKAFTYNGNTYLLTVETNQGGPSPTTLGIVSVYLCTGSSFSLIQSFSSFAYDVEIFQIDTTVYMVVAVWFSSGTQDAPSLVYRWNPNVSQFDLISTIDTPLLNTAFSARTVSSILQNGKRWVFLGSYGAPPLSPSWVYQLI